VASNRSRSLDLAADVGADHTLLPEDDTAEHIRDYHRGPGVAATVDFVGADSTLKLVAQVAQPLGHVTLVGVASGTYTSASSPHPTKSHSPLLAKMISEDRRGPS
jgi:threonine dehydrogenase-like Zn-dependent dehydrogenase